MIATNPVFDLANYEWNHLSDPTETGYRIDYKVALLGYDLSVGTCDFLLILSGPLSQATCLPNFSLSTEERNEFRSN